MDKQQGLIKELARAEESLDQRLITSLQISLNFPTDVAKIGAISKVQGCERFLTQYDTQLSLAKLKPRMQSS